MTRLALLVVPLLVLPLLVVAGPADARRAPRDEPVLELKARVNASTVRAGDSFQLDVVLTARTNTPVEELTLPDLSQLEVLRDNRSQRSSVQLVQGKRSVAYEQHYSYVLRAAAPGTLTIGAGTARLGTNVARSEPIKIRVLPGEGAPGAVPPDDDPAAAKGGRLDPFFLDVSFDKEDVYVGEQATLLVRVFAQNPIDARGLDMPKLPKFWVERLEASSSRPTERTVGGKHYYVYDLHAAALFPLEAGDHQLGSVSITVQTGGGLWSRGRSYTLASKPITLRVKPLPVEGRPADFPTGNIGKWELKAGLSPPQTGVGEPVTLHIVAQGQGNPTSVELPRLPDDIEGVRMFPPTYQDEKGVDRSVLFGKKRAEILLQPLHEGRVRIPPLSLRYFNPATGRYEESRSRPLMLQVGPGGGSGPAAEGGKARIARGARPIRARLDAFGSPFLVYRSAAFPVVIAALGAASLVLFAWGRRRRASSGSDAARRDTAKKRNRHALEQAIAHQNLRQVQAAVVHHVALTFGDEARALPHDELVRWLADRGLETSVAERVGRFLTASEAVLYAPTGAGDRARLVEEARAIVDLLERRPA